MKSADTADDALITSRHWTGLALVATAQFIVVMDSSIIGVSLPEIREALGFDPADLSWVFNAYVLAFGGALLIGGRLSDMFGPRKMFTSGWIVLAAGSLLAGTAWDVLSEIAGRTMQGVGAALIVPAALSLLIALFGGTPSLARAFTIFGAVAPVGGTAGVLLGGLLTEYASWRWIFYVTIPFALFVIAATPRYLPAVPARPGPVSAVSATTVTLGLGFIVYALVQAPTVGWAARAVVGSLALGLLLLALFVTAQRRSKRPLVNPSLFTVPRLMAANLVQFILGAAWIPTWFFLNLYMQSMLEATAVRAGLAMAPMIVTTAVFMMVVVPRLSTHVADNIVIAAGFAFLAASMLWLAAAGRDGTYLTDVFPPSLLASAGMALAFIPSLSAAVSEVPADQTGVASGLVNANYQVGSALGLAVITSLSVAAAGAGAQRSDTGFEVAFGSAAAFALAGAFVAFTFLRTTGPRRSALTSSADT